MTGTDVGVSSIFAFDGELHVWGWRGTSGRREVWRHSAGRMFAQVITDLTLAPGESRSFTATWNQTDAKGKPVPPGRYEAVGLVAGRAPGCRSDSVSFTISL